MISTRFTELVGCSVPVQQAPNGDLARTPALPIAVARAGGHGMLAALTTPLPELESALDELAAEAGGRYLVAKLNVDENPRTAAQFAVRSIPTLLIFKHGQLVDRLVGAHPKHTIAARLAAHM